MIRPDVNFDRALLRGGVAYNGKVGKWWEGQSSDGPHRRAYRLLAEELAATLAGGARNRNGRKRASNPRRRPVVVDYACGGGFFLMELARAMPEAILIGLDGSRKLLEKARDRLQSRGVSCELLRPREAFAARGPRVRLGCTRLPNFRLPEGRADAVAFVFPNLAPGPDEQPVYDRHGFKNRQDAAIADYLSRLREGNPDENDDAIVLYNGLLTERVQSRHMRSLLRRGGTWFKVDYANAPRAELGRGTIWRSLFGEGALDFPLLGRSCRSFFRLQGSRFQRSRVILDVYHQTGDPTDRVGGYFSTTFEAV